MKDTKGEIEKKELSFAEQMRGSAEAREASRSLEFTELREELKKFHDKFLLEVRTKSIYEKIKEIIAKDVEKGRYKTNRKGIKEVKSECYISAGIGARLPIELLREIKEAKLKNPDVQFEHVSWNEGEPSFQVLIQPSFKINPNLFEMIMDGPNKAYFEGLNYRFWEILEELLKKEKIELSYIDYKPSSYGRDYIYFKNGYKKDSTYCTVKKGESIPKNLIIGVSMKF